MIGRPCGWNGPDVSMTSRLWISHGLHWDIWHDVNVKEHSTLGYSTAPTRLQVPFPGLQCRRLLVNALPSIIGGRTMSSRNFLEIRDRCSLQQHDGQPG